MKINLDKRDKYIQITLEEQRLDTLIAPKLKSELVYLNTEGYRNVILNLKEVGYADSSGLSAILRGNQLCKAAGGTFVLTGLRSPVQKLIEISQLTSVLNIVGTQEEAEDLIFIDEIERDIKGGRKKSDQEEE